jgi:sigma-B regulation protein RsbU (phosphoserine phosphatase)
MQESRVPLHSGDLFVFYTDGLTEARNKKNEEFGEERFLKSIKEYFEKSAELVLKNIFTEIRRFSKGATQHDDMSMVVVKVL